MMKFFRKHRNTLMIVIAVLALPFIFYFNKTDLSARGAGDFGKFYNRTISAVEAQRYARLLGLATRLGMTDFIQDLTAGARDDNERAVEFIFNLLILHREAERLGIDAPASERLDFVRNLRVFQGPSGAFDVGKFTEFTQDFLSPNGFTDDQVGELARDDIALRRIKELVVVGVPVPDSETKENYERAYGLISASVLRLHSADFAKDIKVTDDDIKSYYDARQNELKTDEKRKVDFASFILNDDQKKLAAKERVDALQKLQGKATDFSQALLEKRGNFQEVAKKFEVPVQTTGEFTTTNPDPKFGSNGRQLGNAAFQLTNEEPNSELIEVPDGYYVLHLAGVAPARQLSLDEAKPKIVESIKAGRAREAMSTKAAQAAHDLREGLKAGEPLSFAAEKVNLKAESVPPFVLMDDEKDDPKKPKEKTPDLLAVKNAAASLQPGEVSDFFPWEDGGIIVVLEKREPPDEAKYGAKKKELIDRIKTNKHGIVFFEWLREKQREAGLLKEPAAKS
ncbi:MAG TPA: peptidylprolyl isomerase [Chthoniobacterales bacterium]|jgi:hypothetical protein